MASDPPQRQPDLLGPEDDADIPPPPNGEDGRGLAADPLDQDAQTRLQHMSRRGRLLPTVLVLVAIGAFIGIVWWAYQTANRPDAPGEVPVVEAEPGEPKVRPESEGGMDVPNQDKLIYEQLGQGEGQPEVERLLPPPEEPLEPPAPPPAPATDTSALTPPPPPQEIAPSPDAAEAGEPASPAEPAPSASPAPEEAEASAPADPAPEQVAPEEAAPEQTAITPPAAEPAPVEAVPAAPAGGGFRVQFAALKSEADAQKSWAQLQKTHADLLGGLKPTIQRADLGDQGIFYRVQGGPLPSREAAAALCEELKKKNQACLVVKP